VAEQYSWRKRYTCPNGPRLIPTTEYTSRITTPEPYVYAATHFRDVIPVWHPNQTLMKACPRTGGWLINDLICYLPGCVRSCCSIPLSFKTYGEQMGVNCLASCSLVWLDNLERPWNGSAPTTEILWPCLWSAREVSFIQPKERRIPLSKFLVAKSGLRSKVLPLAPRHPTTWR